MFLKAIARVIVTLNSNTSRSQVAAGIASGLLLALVPTGNLLWLFLFFLVFLTKSNYGMVLIVSGLAKLAVPLIAAPLDALGWLILNAKPLQPALSLLYAAPVAPLTRFNNTLVMGGLLAGIVLWPFAFLLARALIGQYRSKLAPRLAGTRLAQAIGKIPLASALGKAVSSISRLSASGE